MLSQAPHSESVSCVAVDFPREGSKGEIAAGALSAPGLAVTRHGFHGALQAAQGDPRFKRRSQTTSLDGKTSEEFAAICTPSQERHVRCHGRSCLCLAMAWGTVGGSVFGRKHGQMWQGCFEALDKGGPIYSHLLLPGKLSQVLQLKLCKLIVTLLKVRDSECVS